MSGFIDIGIEPSLIHPVDVVIERLDLVTTVFDPTYREVVAAGVPNYLAPVTVKAQIKYKPMERAEPASGGVDVKADGYIMMLRTDVEDILGGPLKFGDKLTSVDGEDFSGNPLYIVELKRTGTYQTSRLWKFSFSRRAKSFVMSHREDLA